MQPKSFVAKLKCHLDDRGHPFLKLQPAKKEEMHHEPDIWMFHDVISQEEMKIVRDLAAPLVRDFESCPTYNS